MGLGLGWGLGSAWTRTNVDIHNRRLAKKWRNDNNSNWVLFTFVHGCLFYNFSSKSIFITFYKCLYCQFLQYSSFIDHVVLYPWKDSIPSWGYWAIWTSNWARAWEPCKDCMLRLCSFHSVAKGKGATTTKYWKIPRSDPKGCRGGFDLLCR